MKSTKLEKIREYLKIIIRHRLHMSAFCNEEIRYLDELEHKLVEDLSDLVLNEKDESYLLGIKKLPHLL